MKNGQNNFTVLPTQPVEGPNFAAGIDIDYGSLFKRILRNWYWFVLTVSIMTALAWLQLRYENPIYSASATMLVEEKTSGGGFSKEALTQELGFETSYVIDNEIYVLRSRYLMERVVKLLNLDITYLHKGLIRETEIYRPKVFQLVPADTLFLPYNEPIRYGSVEVRFDNSQRFTMVATPGDTTSVNYNTPFLIGNRRFSLQLRGNIQAIDRTSFFKIGAKDPVALAGKYSSKLRVSQVGRSSVVALNITDPVPFRAREVLDMLIDVYGQQIIEQQSKTGEQTLRFIEERLDFVTRELYEVESNVAGFRQNEGMAINLETRGVDYLNQLNTADAQLAELQIRRELIENLRNSLLRDSTNFRPIPVSSEVTTGVLSELIQEYNRLIFERSKQLETVTANHPTMAPFTENLASFRRNILQSVGTVLRETNRRAEQIRARIQPLEAQINRIPQNQRKLVQIMRQQQIKENLFLFLLQKREDAALTVAAQVPNTRIIDRAMVSSRPISPSKPMKYLFAIGIGLLFPGTIIFLREIFNNKLSTEEEVNKYINAPILGRIVKSSEHGSILVNKGSRSGIAETFRLMRTNLGFVLPKEGSSVILLTSSISGEGKSFISANLASSFTLAKKKVVVIGADMRKPRLGQIVTGEKFDNSSPGLSNYLIGKADYKDILTPTGRENLSMITSGPLPPNPSELLMEDRLEELMVQLRKDFDIIILDAAPVGIVSDALLLKDHIDITLFVMRFGHTLKKNLQYTSELVNADKLPRFNIVLNGLDPKEHYGYGYGYY